MRLANQDWDLSLMEGITIKNFDFIISLIPQHYYKYNFLST